MAARMVKAAAALWAATMVGTALGNPGQGFTWSFQTTSLMANSSNAQTVAMMRNGLAWPVVVTDYSMQGGYGSSATLFPTTGSATTGPASNWQNVGAGFFNNTPYRLRGASSPDGRVAFAATDSSGNGLGGRVSSVTGGWGALPAGTKAVAFDANGTLYTATSTSVSGVGGYSGTASIVDMAVSPTGEVGLISADRKYWQYSNWLGAWTSITLPWEGPTPMTDSYDVEFDSFGRPHVVAMVPSSGFGGIAWDFNTVTGSWSSTVLAGNLSSSARLTLAANTVGTVGTAWIDNAGQVIYAYKTDLDNWSTAVVTSTGSSFSPGGQVGVTYDYADLPVLAYRPSTGNIILAYDPIVVPEPAGISLLAMAACVMTSRRGRRTA